jgi:drug/metabolite transporter (DMT)-like permease
MKGTAVKGLTRVVYYGNLRVVKRELTADLILLSVGAIWGLNFVAMKYLLAVISPVNLILFRFLTGGSLLFILLALTEDLKVSRKDLLYLSLLGIEGITVYQFFFTYSVKYTSVTNVSIIINTAPLYGGLLSALFGYERFRKALFLAAGVGLLGTWMLITKGTFRLEGGETLGDLLSVASSLLWALYALLAKPLLARHSPLKVTAYSMAIGSAFLCPFLPFYFSIDEFVRLSPMGWAALGFAVLFSVVIAFFLWYKGISKVGPTRALIYQYSVPVFAVLFACLLLGERFSVAQAAGALLVLISIGLAHKG